MHQRAPKNALLRQLAQSDFARLEADLVERPLEFKQPVLEPGETVHEVYFVERGLVSIVTELEGGELIETSMVGKEGMVGLSAVLGGGPTANLALCQVPGSALVLPTEVLQAERAANPGWFELLLRYANFMLAMMSQTAACNRVHTVEARMSRWLLMTGDRVEDDEFPLTQEFLAQMLGVARPTVNIAGTTLQRAGLIDYSRGRVAIVDRKGLESTSCECYWRIRDSLQAVFRAAGATGAANRRPRRREASQRP